MPSTDGSTRILTTISTAPTRNPSADSTATVQTIAFGTPMRALSRKQSENAPRRTAIARKTFRSVSVTLIAKPFLRRNSAKIVKKSAERQDINEILSTFFIFPLLLL